MHLAYIWIVSHLSAKNYRNWWKFDEVLTKTNLLSFFWGHGVPCDENERHSGKQLKMVTNILYHEHMKCVSISKR